MGNTNKSASPSSSAEDIVGLNESWWKRQKNRYRNWRNRHSINDMDKETSPLVEEINSSEKQVEEKEKEIVIYRLSEEDKHEAILSSINEELGEDISESNFQKIVHKVGGVFKKWGNRDGQHDISIALIGKIANDTASLIKATISVRIEGVIAKLNIEGKGIEEVEKQVNQELEEKNEARKKLEKLYNHDYKLFSKELGYFYLVASILLLLADIPLALQVTAQGFRLTTLFSQWALAIGITMCAVYVKLYWDMYMGSQLDKISKPIQSRPGFWKNEHNRGDENYAGDDYDDLREKHISKGLKVNNLRWVIHTLLFIITVSTVVVLNIFRYHFLATVSRSKLFQEIILYSGGTAKWSFILVGTLFPIIGGILMSVGLNKIQNASVRKKFAEELRRLREKLEEIHKEKLKVEEQKKNLETKRSWLEGDNGKNIDKAKEFFIACYLYGYEHGISYANKSLDLFDKVYRQFKKTISLENLEKSKNLYTKVYPLYNNEHNKNDQ